MSSHDLSDGHFGSEVGVVQNASRKTFKLHLYGAAVFSVPLTILAITGCILTFGEQMDHLLHPVPTVAARGQALPL